MSEDLEAVKIKANADVKIAETKVAIAELVAKASVAVSSIIMAGIALLGFTRCSEVSNENAVTEAKAEAETEQVAFENGYEQVKEGWTSPNVLWKKKDGTSYAGDFDAEKAASSEAKTR